MWDPLYLLLDGRISVTHILKAASYLGKTTYNRLILFITNILQSVKLKCFQIFSAYGAVLFNMGSILSWAIIRSLLPSNSGLATIAGLVSGLALTSCGVAYLSYNDKTVKANKK